MTKNKVTVSGGLLHPPQPVVVEGGAVAELAAALVRWQLMPHKQLRG
jgi:hypothetical protein